MESLSRFAALLPGAFLLVGAEGTVRDANEPAARLLGRPRERLLGAPLSALCACSGAELAEALRSCARSSSFTPVALRFHAEPSGTVDARAQGALLVPPSDPSGPLVLLHVVPRSESSSRFIALNQRIDELNNEITRRKWVEHELARERELLHVTLSSIGDAVIATDTEGLVTFLNPVAEQLTGWSLGDALGRALREVFHIVREGTLEPVEYPVARVVREGGVAGLSNHAMLVSRSGGHVAIDDSAAPILSDDGSTIGVVLVFHDVTERSVMQRELARQAQALMEMDRRKDEFLAMLAHELRNPLAPLRTAAEILQSGRAGATQLERLGGMMQRQVGQLTRMVDDLLDVARITRGKIELRRGATSLNAVIERALETARPALDGQGHRLAVSLPDPPVPLHADGARLAQAVANVLLNAAKFTAPAGDISIVACAKDGLALVRITDNGIGMTPHVVANAFELFAQGEQALDRNFGGLGIGLTLVRTIVQLHEGTVEACSPGPGQGSVISLRIPLAAVPAAAAADSARPDAAAGTRPEARNILVVDDNTDAAATLESLLAGWGHLVRTAAGSEEALNLVESFRPDLALLDIGMPGMDGYQLATRLRGRLGPQPVLVALTGYGTAAAREKSSAAGFSAHLTKPAEPAELQALIANLPERATG